jgi:hypothetical protein
MMPMTLRGSTGLLYVDVVLGGGEVAAFFARLTRTVQAKRRNDGNQNRPEIFEHHHPRSQKR